MSAFRLLSSFFFSQNVWILPSRKSVLFQQIKPNNPIWISQFNSIHFLSLNLNWCLNVRLSRMMMRLFHSVPFFVCVEATATDYNWILVVILLLHELTVCFFLFCLVSFYLGGDAFVLRFISCRVNSITLSNEWVCVTLPSSV